MNLKLKNFALLLTLLFGAVVVLGGYSLRSHSPMLDQSSQSTLSAAKTLASPAPLENSPIRSFDFENFTFPASPLYGTGASSFTLKDGEYAGRLLDGGVEPEPVSLVDKIYGDVTADGNEEALLVFTINIRGSAIPYYVYIYATEDNKPKLIWSFGTGDRAEGGLRRVFAHNGELVVELYGKNKFVGGNLYAQDDSIRGACCPSLFTRSHYEWKSNNFRRTDQLEVLQNPDGSAPFLPLLVKRK